MSAAEVLGCSLQNVWAESVVLLEVFAGTRVVSTGLQSACVAADGKEQAAERTCGHLTQIVAGVQLDSGAG